MQLPRLLRSGRRLRLVVQNSSITTNIEVQKGVWFGSDVEVNSFASAKLTIKSGTSVQDRCKLIGQVTIERGVILAPGIFISSGTHNFNVRPALTIRDQDQMPESDHGLRVKTHIEEDCWLGINVFVKPGVYIGRGAVVGANASVLKDVEPYQVIVGAHKPITPRLSFAPREDLDHSRENDRPYFYRGFGSQGQVLDTENLLIFAKSTSTQRRLKIYGQGLEALKGAFASDGRHFLVTAGSSTTCTLDVAATLDQKDNLPTVLQAHIGLRLDLPTREAAKARVVISRLEFSS